MAQRRHKIREGRQVHIYKDGHCEICGKQSWVDRQLFGEKDMTTYGAKFDTKIGGKSVAFVGGRKVFMFRGKPKIACDYCAFNVGKCRVAVSTDSSGQAGCKGCHNPAAGVYGVKPITHPVAA